MDRRTFARTIGTAIALVPVIGETQQPPRKIYRIGFLGLISASAYASRVEALRAGLRDLGYIWCNPWIATPQPVIDAVRDVVNRICAQNPPGSH